MSDRKKSILQSIYDKLLIVLNYISVVLIFLTAIWIFGDVVGRFFFNQPIPGTTELVKTAILPIVFLGAPYTLQKHGHIRTTVLVRRMSPVNASLFGIVSCIIGIAVFSLMSIYGWEAAVKSLAVREFEGVQLRVPTYPSRFIMVIGSVLLTVQFVINLVDNLKALRAGEGAES